MRVLFLCLKVGDFMKITEETIPLIEKNFKYKTLSVAERMVN